MRTRQCTVRCTLSVEPLIWCCERPCHDSCPGSCDSQYAVYTAGSNVQYEILKVQVHTTAARKESPWTASSRPTRYVNRVFAAPRPRITVHVHPTVTRARAGHPHALALDPTAAVRVRPARAHPRAPHTATRRVLGGHEPPSRAPPRPPQRRTQHLVDTRARGRRWRRRRHKPPPSCRPVVHRAAPG